MKSDIHHFYECSGIISCLHRAFTLQCAYTGHSMRAERSANGWSGNRSGERAETRVSGSRPVSGRGKTRWSVEREVAERHARPHIGADGVS